MQIQPRHEYKHRINNMDYVLLKGRLEAIMQRDIHTDKNGEYIVRSLYFDTPKDKALREKIYGINRREKFRLRRYIGTKDYYLLEKKSKKNGLCYKQSCRLTREEIELIQKNDFDWMAFDKRDLVQELYSKTKYEQLRPKTIVEYIREPFTYSVGNVRVTFDRDIRTGLFSTGFLSDELPLLKTEAGLVILEVKYDQFIPDHIVMLLQLDGRRASACSKYAMCRIYG